jgi:flagellar biosynthesis regulator FlaF
LSELSKLQTVIDAGRLDHAVSLLMDASRYWSVPDCEGRLPIALETSKEMWRVTQLALASSETSLPAEVRSNLLIISVYAQGKLTEFAAAPSREKLASLISITRNLAASLRDWRQAA